MKNFKSLKTLALLLVVGSIFSNIFSSPIRFPNTVSTLEISESHEDML